MYDIAKILIIFDENDKKKSGFDALVLSRIKKTASKIIKYGFFTLLLSFFVSFIGKHFPSNEFLKLMAILIYFVGELMVIIGVGFEAILGFWRLFSLRKQDAKVILFEMNTHLRAAKKISNYKKEKIELTKFYLQGKIDSSERRIKLFFGTNSTCVALFGLAYSLLAHFDYLNWLPSAFINPLGIADLWKFAVMAFLALFAGILLGTFFLKGTISRYQNKIFILDFSLKQKELSV
ncbi:hypothetical protein ACQZ19_13645 [Rahnella variigena]|uniref:hypothetical protein n=1 Tax=Rahnella variigena TaxID=574964 RepID=UPI003D2E61A2